MMASGENRLSTTMPCQMPVLAQSQAPNNQFAEITVIGTRDSALNPYFFSPSLLNTGAGGQFLAQDGIAQAQGNRQALSARQLILYGGAGGATVGAGTVGGYAAVVGAEV